MNLPMKSSLLTGQTNQLIYMCIYIHELVNEIIATHWTNKSTYIHCTCVYIHELANEIIATHWTNKSTYIHVYIYMNLPMKSSLLTGQTNQLIYMCIYT